MPGDRCKMRAPSWLSARITMWNPSIHFAGSYACTTREAVDGGPPGGLISQEKLPLADCISAYTSGSAYAEFMDGKKGELKVGEFCVFVILSQDLTKIPPRDILKTEVLRHRCWWQDGISQ